MIISNIYTIFQKEFMAYFRSKLGYVVLIIYALLVTLSVFFGTNFLSATSETLKQLFETQTDILLLIIPALTMRLWTDEQRQNTLELLLSQPITVSAMVIGKFMASWFLCFMLQISVLGIWLFSALELELDTLGIIINFSACLLMSAALCSICQCVSALTSHAITSFVISLLICFFLYNVNFDLLLEKTAVSNEVIIRCSQVLNFKQHFTNIISGQLTISNLFYYVSFIILTLWFTTVAVEYKRSQA